MSSYRRHWKQHRSEVKWSQFIRSRNQYFQAIKNVKVKFWTTFLVEAEEKDVFQVFKYTKSCLVEKISSLQIFEDTLTTEFVTKYDTFL